MMNSNSIARSTSTLWLRRGIAAMGMLLISGTVALSIASQVPLKIAPAAAPVASAPSARERFVAFKEKQATRVMDAAMGDVVISGVPVANERYAEFKDAQADAHDATFVPRPVQKNGRERYAEFKDAQADAHDATFVPASSLESGRARYAEFNQKQAELHEGSR
jgi:hypothetical protein